MIEVKDNGEIRCQGSTAEILGAISTLLLFLKKSFDTDMLLETCLLGLYSDADRGKMEKIHEMMAAHGMNGFDRKGEEK